MRPERKQGRAVVLLHLFLLLAAGLPAGCSDAPTPSTNDSGLGVLAAEPRRDIESFLDSLASGSDRASLILCKAADLNADGRQDIVVIFAPPKGSELLPGHSGNLLCVLVSGPDGRRPTNFQPAPHERQTIQFRDIDGKPPVEFVVTGAKGPNTGLGVYRVTGFVLENLFGESMDECC